MVEIVPSQEYMNAFITLVREYTDSIRRQDASLEGTLSSRHLDAELADMEKKYGGPGGRRYLLIADRRPAGCPALARNDDACCKIRRRYVLPEYRGHGCSSSCAVR